MENNLAIEIFIRAVAEGFVSNRQQIILFISILSAIVFFFIFMLILIKALERRKINRVYKNRYKELIRRFDLTINELDLIDELSSYLISKEKKYLLLVNKAAFSFALRKFEENPGNQALPREVLNSLLLKTGLKVLPKVKNLESTRSLPVGMAIKIEDDEGKRIVGQIESNNASGLVAGFPSVKAVFRKGHSYPLFACRYQGILVYMAKLIERNETSLHFEHTETTDREKIIRNLNVYVQIENWVAEKTYKLKILFLNHKDIIIGNEEKIFRKGDDLRISFRPALNNPFFTNAEITKLKNRKKTAHARFKHVV